MAEGMAGEVVVREHILGGTAWYRIGVRFERSIDEGMRKRRYGRA